MSLYLDCVRLAEWRLARPPRSEFSRRVERRGELVVPFILSNELARPVNATRHKNGWSLYEHRKRVLREMAAQLFVWQKETGQRITLLDGRPQVNAVRFSTRSTDAYANFAKEAIDVLQPPRRVKNSKTGFYAGLDIIAGDSPEQIEENQWHELIRAAEPAFVYLEVRRRG